jgi:hypothetical protein
MCCILPNGCHAITKRLLSQKGKARAYQPLSNRYVTVYQDALYPAQKQSSCYRKILCKSALSWLLNASVKATISDILFFVICV